MVSATLNDRPWKALRWLVLAPHADDETLGAGALIAQTAANGHFMGLVYLTDGSGSHPSADGRAGKLIAARRREAACALSRLTGGCAQRPIHLDWEDAAPAVSGSPRFARSVSMLAAICRRLRVDAIAVTARHEPHCDHEAAAELALMVRKQAKRPIIVAQYCIWATPPSLSRFREIRSSAMLPGVRRHALRSHRSQLTASYGPGFRLPKWRQRMALRDSLFIERRP